MHACILAFSNDPIVQHHNHPPSLLACYFPSHNVCTCWQRRGGLQVSVVSCDVRSATCGGLVMYAGRGGGPYILLVVTLM